MVNTITRICDPDAAVRIVFGGTATISANNQIRITFPITERKALRFESGLLQAQNDAIILRGRSDHNATTLTAAQKIATVIISCKRDGVEQEEEFREVLSVVVASQMIKVAVAQSDTGSVSGSGHSGGGHSSGGHSNGGHSSGSSRADSGQPDPEKEALKKQIAKAAEIMNGLQRTVKALQEENANLRAENGGLNRAVEAGVDQILTDMRSRSISVSQQVQQKLQTLETLRNEIEANTAQQREIQCRIEEKKTEKEAAETCLHGLQAELTHLQDQIQQSLGQAEVTDLDCQKAKDELKALRARLQMSADVVELTESRWLKNNSVTETMKEMQKKIEAVEDRIGFILNARELYGNAVQSAVLLGGDGTVSADDESGNGARSSAEATETPENGD